jgi:propionyl-CoA carboxylase alpha chain/3-methylcrotonyl-CoA carboxylase alpha subunit/acetyl-CoA/propionyl-CoA carboxylase biotin carboxyl carrier protein
MKKISKVLISNRGEIACRILRTLEQLNIPGVVVYHSLDADSLAVRMASQAVEIDGVTPVAAYLDSEKIIEACRKTGADAVHPGYGFLAENAKFAKRLGEAGVTFIGPLPENIELMGNKIAARTFCLKNGLPLAPSVTEEQGSEVFAELSRQIGFPLLIKAAAGGGGKGMHIVRKENDLDKTIQIAKVEALRAFGKDEVYVERYVEQPRHIEVQVLADHHGNVIHLGERECSIQRRFQKVIEESPAPNLPSQLRQEICNTAVDLTKKAGYKNAGTVEFILAPDGQFYFLEMNTRLQVEHPVTEMVTDLDLVELQIRVAQGETLPFKQGQVQFKGHAIELRLYAEDPEKNFMPDTGLLLAYSLPRGESVRVENGFTEGMKVSSAFDPMLAKLIIHGRDRDEAIDRGLRSLKDTLILGVVTNTDYLQRILSHPTYVAGKIHTGFLPLHEDDLRQPALADSERNLLLAAAALSNREFNDPAFKVPEPYKFFGQWRN